MRLVWAAVAAGLVLRAAFALGYWTGKPLTHDEREYLALAAGVAQGRGFTHDLPGEPADPDVQRFGRAPVYPLFLAPLTWTSAALRAGRLPDEVPAAVKIAQAVVGAMGIWFVAAIAARAGGRRAGVAAAWLAALHPPLVFICAYALSEALYTTLALATVWLVARVTDPGSDAASHTGPVRMAAVAGLAAGIAALTRPAMLFYLPIAGFLLWRYAPGGVEGARRAAALAGAAVLLILPWTVRNAMVHDRVVLIASEGGVTFWTGNHPEAIGEGDMAANPHLKVRNREFRDRHAGLSEEALEPLYYREAFAHIADAPLRWAGLLSRKLWYTFVPTGPSYRLHSRRYVWATVLPYLALLPPAIAGLRRAWPTGWPRAMLGLAASAVLVSLVFFPQERFRIPSIDPALIVAAALCARRTGPAGDAGGVV